MFYIAVIMTFSFGIIYFYKKNIDEFYDNNDDDSDDYINNLILNIDDNYLKIM